jgi:hypothetical protein
VTTTYAPHKDAGPADRGCGRLGQYLARVPAGLVVRRAWPHRDGGLSVETVTSSPPGIVGVEITAARVQVLAGADRRLPALAAELARPGAELLGHRPGRRAVLRQRSADGIRYVKVVRPGHATAVAAGLHAGARLAAGTGGLLVVPEVLTVDDAAGVVRLDALPGPTLHELLTAATPHAVDTAARVGAVLTVLGAGVDELPHHDAAAESAVLRHWASAASRWGGPDLHRTADTIVAAMIGLPPEAPVVAHRDLHDKQVVAVGSGVGLLDLDTLCRAHPALDRGNLLAHLQLRVLQGRCPHDLADACAAGLRRGQDRADVRALAVHTAAALLRLAGVYTFRPGPRGLPDLLHAAAHRALTETTRSAS